MVRRRKYGWIRGFGSFLESSVFPATINSFQFLATDVDLIDRMIFHGSVRAFVSEDVDELENEEVITWGVAYTLGTVGEWPGGPSNTNGELWEAVRMDFPMATQPRTPLTIEGEGEYSGYVVHSGLGREGIDLKMSRSLVPGEVYTAVVAINKNSYGSGQKGALNYVYSMDTYFQILVSAPL